MKKIIISLTCFLFVIGVNAQSEALLGKWNVFEITGGGKTFGLDKLKESGDDNIYVEFLSDGVFNTIEKGEIQTGRWEYDADTKTIKTFWEDRSGFTPYGVEAVETDYLTLKWGDMLWKYKKDLSE